MNNTYQKMTRCARPVVAPLYRRAGAGRAGRRGAGASTSKSAVSHRFIAATDTALEQLMTRWLHDLELVALMIDGVYFGEHT